MTQAASPTKVISGGNHHRSVRNVFAAIAARLRPARSSAGPVGLVAVVVIRSPDVPCPSDPAVNGRGAHNRHASVMCGTRYAWARTVFGSGMMSMSQTRGLFTSTWAHWILDLGNRARQS